MRARSPPFPSTLACWSLEWRSRSPQHSMARHLLKTNSLPRWPAPHARTHARPCRGGGGSGARLRGTRGRSRSLLVRFVDRRCVLVQLLLSRNEPQGRRRALLAFRCEVNEYVTRGFAVFATICSEGTIRRFGPEEEGEGFES